jgi:hypothetical protein
MTQAHSTRLRTSEIDSRIENARRELAELERTEALDEVRRQAEQLIWYRQKWEKFNPGVNRYLELFPMIQALETDWRRDIFCGRDTLEDQADQAMRGLYALWLFGCKLFKEHAEYLARHVSDDALDQSLNVLGKYAREGDRLLRTWEPPALSLGYSFRAPALSQEAAHRFRDMFPEAN